MKVQLEKFIEENDNVIVGVSGGADSMCLLSLLLSYKKSHNFQLTVVHVNHGIRGEEARKDAELVRAFAMKSGVEFVLKNVDAPSYAKQTAKSLEEACRELRYEALSEVKREKGANKIFIAHNLCDQAETIFMHIARGSSLSGATGMDEVRSDIYRPLLFSSREEILDYNKKHGIEFVTDSTNLDSSYTRNFLRNEVFPLIKTKYANFEGALVNFAKLCKEDEDYIVSTLPKDLLKKQNGGVKIDENAKFLHDALLSRLIKNAINALEEYKDFNEVHIESIKLLYNKKSSSEISLPHGVKAFRDSDGIFLKKCGGEKEPAGEEKFSLGDFVFGENHITIEKTRAVSEFEKGKLYVDLAKIPSDAVLRAPKVGDIFSKLGASGKKKLGDYFTDKKIPLRERQDVVVLASGSVVLAVLGHDISGSVKIDQNTKDIAVILTGKINEK